MCAVYLAAYVTPQARRAIRRRRVVFRREVPSKLTAWHPYPCRARRLHHGRRAVATLRASPVGTSPTRVLCLSHSPVSEARRLSLGRAEVLSADGLYRFYLSVARQREPCCSRVHRVESNNRSNAAPHCPDPNLSTDVRQLVGCRPVRTSVGTVSGGCTHRGGYQTTSRLQCAARRDPQP